ncbi:abortive infection family protein [Pseudomonas aeruginosa]|uniref:abortive infection family protein n=1 Tax=Pseudomonas aeruginosa TaxID=287 RepID=UPI002F915950
MDKLLHAILREIKTGVTSFDSSSAGGDIKKFQDIAKAVVYAHDQGYVSRVIPHMESMSGQLRYDCILVSGGLTYLGEQTLIGLSGQPTPIDEAFSDILNRIPSYNIREKWDKALHRRITDPSGAITAARSLLEATLKWIIEQRGGKPTENNKELFNRAIDALGIEIKGKPIEKTTNGLNTIIWGIGEMRNNHGDAHGAASNSTPPTVSEAGFCVNLAGAAALFLLEEFENGEA